MIFLDKTFCASPGCKNECGKKMNKKEEERLARMREKDWTSVDVGQAYFCGEPENE